MSFAVLWWSVRKERCMKTFAGVCFLSGFLVVTGCQQKIVEPDLKPPAIPRGLSTETGDSFIEVFWNQNTDPDLDGYNVYVSSSYDGKYLPIGTTRQMHFVDSRARNGSTYYYAVSAFDFNGNESALSRDVAYDTPRPEGYEGVLKNYRSVPGAAGYAFS